MMIKLNNILALIAAVCVFAVNSAVAQEHRLMPQKGHLSYASDWFGHPGVPGFTTVSGNKYLSYRVQETDARARNRHLQKTVFLRYSPVTLSSPDDLLQRSFQEEAAGGGFMHSISTKPGYAFLASGLLPGLGQAANKQWWKTALFVTVEAAAIGIYVHNTNRARSVERRYWNMADNNWSVVNYASWLIDYHNNQNPSNPVNPDNILNPEYRGNGIPDPAFDNSQDWPVINLTALRQLERSTIHPSTGNPFSHDLPDYGSQQYYELISKYWQFGPGWRDWDNSVHTAELGNEGMPPLWREHARIEEIFNDRYRLAGNMFTLLLMNHFISAFDALFTVRIRNHRMQASVSSGYIGGFNVRFNF
jgi:hypothetical protein